MTTMTAPDRADDIKAKLDALHAEVDGLIANAPSTYATAVNNRVTNLHKALARGLDEQGATLGLTTTQVDQLNAGGGTNKD